MRVIAQRLTCPCVPGGAVAVEEDQDGMVSPVSFACPVGGPRNHRPLRPVSGAVTRPDSRPTITEGPTGPRRLQHGHAARGTGTPFAAPPGATVAEQVRTSSDTS